MHRPTLMRLHALACFILFFTALLLGGKPLEAQTGESCEPVTPDPATWVTDGLLLINESVVAIPVLMKPDLACTTEFAAVLPGGRVKVLLDEGDFLYVMHANDNFRNGWVPSAGFSPVEIPLIPFNLDVPAVPVVPETPTVPEEAESPTEPVNPVVPVVPVEPVVTETPEEGESLPDSGYAVSGNTISFADDGWYQVQAVTTDGLVGICEGFLPCEVGNGTYIVINLTSGERFENVVVAAESEVPAESEPPEDGEPSPIPGFTISGNTISLPDDGWYQVQAVTAEGIFSICEGVRTCDLAAGAYIVINLTTGDRFENVVVPEEPEIPSQPEVPTEVEPPAVPETPGDEPEEGEPQPTPGFTVSGTTISLPDDGWYQVQAVTANGIVDVCEGVRTCDVVAGTYIIINLTKGERFENVVVAADPEMPSQPEVPTEFEPPLVPETPPEAPEGVGPLPTPGFTVSDTTISLPDDGWYQVQAVTADGIVAVCEGVRTCDVTAGEYIIINLTSGERFENVIVSMGPELPAVPENPVEPEVPVEPELPSVPDTEQRSIPTSQVKPYVSDGPYAEALEECAFSSSPLVLSEICSLGKLPYIGQTTDEITVEHVMERTLVTHDWMGARLRMLLNELPDDILPLFAPVSMLVIGSEIRPASFNALLGRLMIDPGALWMTVPEKKTVSPGTDFRMNFGADLQFVSLWRWMRGDEFAIPPSSLLDVGTREFETIMPLAASVLYHELAHANDLVRPGNLALLDSEATPALASELFVDDRIAVGLYSDSGLTSRRSVLYGLAGVRFGNIPPSDFQKSLLADYVGGVMGSEGKQLFYGYSSIFEDVATLFEHTMMRYHFGIETLVGFMNKPQGHPEAACNDYKVAWGVRNRIASPLVAPRAKYVTERLIGESPQLDAFFTNAIGESVPLREGDGWCDARFKQPSEISGRFQDAAEDNRQFRFERELITLAPR